MRRSAVGLGSDNGNKDHGRPLQSPSANKGLHASFRDVDVCRDGKEREAAKPPEQGKNLCSEIHFPRNNAGNFEHDRDDDSGQKHVGLPAPEQQREPEQKGRYRHMRLSASSIFPISSTWNREGTSRIARDPGLTARLRQRAELLPGCEVPATSGRIPAAAHPMPGARRCSSKGLPPAPGRVHPGS